MKKLSLLSFGLIFATGLLAKAEVCFTAAPKQDIFASTCGPVEAQVNIRDCSTREVQKTFEATMGLNCRESPRTLNLLYNGNMLVGQMSSFDESGDYILSKTFVRDFGRQPASLQNKRAKGERCFDAVVLDKPDNQACTPVHARFQLRDCETNANQGEAFEAIAHYNCHRHQITYWYKDSLLVGTVKGKQGHGYKVANTHSWVFDQIFGSVDERKPASEVPANSACTK